MVASRFPSCHTTPLLKIFIAVRKSWIEGLMSSVTQGGISTAACVESTSSAGSIHPKMLLNRNWSLTQASGFLKASRKGVHTRLLDEGGDSCSGLVAAVAGDFERSPLSPAKHYTLTRKKLAWREIKFNVLISSSFICDFTISCEFTTENSMNVSMRLRLPTESRRCCVKRPKCSSSTIDHSLRWVNG